MRWICFPSYPNSFHAVACAGSLLLNTHAVPPMQLLLMCAWETTNIALAQVSAWCAYRCAERMSNVLWVIGIRVTSMQPINYIYISGHTTLPHTTTYQEVVVDSVTHVAAITIAVTLFPAIGYRAIHSSPMQKECGWYQIWSKFQYIMVTDQLRI